MKVMKNISWLFIVLLMLMISSCGQKHEKTTEEKPVVSVSISPLKYFAGELAGDFLQVNVMVPETSNPATYEPTPKQMSLLARSDAYLGVKPLIFEKTWMPKFKFANKDMKIYDMSKGIDFINRKAGRQGTKSADPHVWISPQTVETLVKNMRDALLELYPGNEKEIKENYQSLQKVIKQKHQFLKQTFQEREEISFLIFHPALGYLARDYGLNQLIIQHQGKEPSPRELRRITEKARKNDVSQVFVQKQFDTRNAETVADELGVELTLINPLAKNWPEEIEKIGRSLGNANK